MVWFWKKCAFAVLLIGVWPAGLACAASGVKGHVVWREKDVPGIVVRAYRSVADIAAERMVAASMPTGKDGAYLLELPPGNYFLTARSYEGSPRPGEYFCYFSGAPVSVRGGSYSDVGFNLIRIPAEAAPTPSAGSGIAGEIVHEGERLSRVYLYLYRDGKDGFKGPGYLVQPVEKGSFQLRVPPGDYYLIARKRAKGGQFGPIETGDYFGYYYANPVRVSAGTTRNVKLEVVRRRPGQEAPAATFRGVRGQVRTVHGQPAAGVRVFAYREAQMSGSPDHLSAVTGADGRFELSLPGEGPYYLLAREALGGPAEAGELFGKYCAAGGTCALRLPGRDAVRDIEIRVEPVHRP